MKNLWQTRSSAIVCFNGANRESHRLYLSWLGEFTVVPMKCHGNINITRSLPFGRLFFTLEM